MPRRSWSRRAFLAAGLAAPAAWSTALLADQQGARPFDPRRAVRRDGSSPLPPDDWPRLGTRLAGRDARPRHQR